MKVLVINAGSSSVKYQLIDSDSSNVIAKGLCERIGIGGAMTYKPTGKGVHKFDQPLKSHTDAIKLLLEALLDPKIGVVKSMDEIDAVGHRIAHGGEKFCKSALITDELIETLVSISGLAPLHNPANIMGINACRAIMPNTPMVGVFDTAFHQTMPKEAYIYPIPYEAYTEHMIRRYGFHGTSHLYVSGRIINKLGKPAEETRIITCHLGNGSSIAAIKGGKSIDTSMGFTPLEGVPMGTRCGDIDPAMVTYLMENLNMDIAGVTNYLNKKSGVQGISGVSSDFRDLWEAANSGNERAKLALNVFCYRVKKYIGAYSAALGGVDAIIFTAGIGENDPDVRALCVSGLEYLGVDFDNERNQTCPRGCNEERELTKPGSKVKVFMVPTDEERVIAQDTARLASK